MSGLDENAAQLPGAPLGDGAGANGCCFVVSTDDVEPREGKTPGGFSHFFPDLGLPFVFTQFVGTADDVWGLLHECGHAFQNYCSHRLGLLAYVFPTSEASEVQSLSLEFLAHPWLERFFGAGAERSRRHHLERTLVVLVSAALVDDFQHQVYAQPSLDAAQRRALWRDLERQYLPWRDYGGFYPHLATGTGWHAVQHLFSIVRLNISCVTSAGSGPPRASVEIADRHDLVVGQCEVEEVAVFVDALSTHSRAHFSKSCFARKIADMALGQPT